ncbi:MAG: patatin-like phospholipase family protein [Bacteroidales bacterium]|nr:patatin-like phospholipase family protein [Bacteroidales bacterium]
MRLTRRLRLIRTRPTLGLFACLVLLATGCRAMHQTPPEPPPHYGVCAVIDQAAPPGTYPAVQPAVAQALRDRFNAPAETLPPAPNVPPPDIPKQKLNVLALSGGGQFGTFAAGLLVGWTESGTRPTFDVCTGISSGALTAAFAFLGPKYDESLYRLAVHLRGRDVFRVQPVRQLIRNQAIASSNPLERIIDQEFDQEYMDDLRQAHANGRRLFVGTMNLQSKRLVVWDLGAIASSGRADADWLVRKILLGTSSISGFVPAVEIPVMVNGEHFIEQHVDGGGVSQVFVRFGEHHPRYGDAGPTQPWLRGSNLYLIAGGKLWTDPNMAKQGAVARAASTVSGTLYALYRANLMEIFALCAASGMNYHLMAIPQDVDITAGSVSFDQELMRRLFSLGHHFGKTGIPWRLIPPGAADLEEEKPRAGVIFQVP